MIKFVVCDDNKEIATSVSHIIDKVMFQNKIMYEKLVFSEYDKEFIKVVEDKVHKIYILDIEVKNKSGIDIARMIRKTDSSSIIIFLTSHMEEGFNVLKGDYMCLSFISKLDNYKKHLERSLKYAVTSSESKSLSITDKGIVFNIKLDDILYIYRDTNERKVVVVTTSNRIKISKSIDEITQLTGFLKTHRSCIVNKNRVTYFDFKNKKILFDNGVEITYISDAYKGRI